MNPVGPKIGLSSTKSHLAFDEAVKLPRFRYPGQPEYHVGVVELRLRLYRHRHGAVAEGARASDLGWTIISGLVSWWVAVEEEGKERRTKRKERKKR